MEEYYTRWQRLAEVGAETHDEADFITSFGPATVLDAGCGMGRVAIELAKRGIAVVGVDLDDDLLGFARRSAPEISWMQCDLAEMKLETRFDVVAMPGNVMIFCRPEDRARVIKNAAAHLGTHGLLITGFSIERGAGSLQLNAYDSMCATAGLELVERWATWDRIAFAGGDYAVSVHGQHHVQ